MEKYFILLFFILLSCTLPAQDIDDLLNEVSNDAVNYAEATFKSTRIINGHSVAQLSKQHLDFRISHRFGVVSNGITDFMGLDKSSIRFTLEYGITDWLSVGIGRSSFGKTYDGSVKWRILRQSTGKKVMPVSISYFGGIDVFTNEFTDLDRTNYLSSRFSYVHQLLVARKFGEKLSLQISPTLVHRNLVPTVLDMNDLLAAGIGGRYKITKRMAVTAEYFYTIRSPRSTEVHNDPLSVGIDIETGGHVFQLMLTNSSIMYDGGFISGQNNDNFFKGDIHLGFNISRIFSFKK